MVWGIILLAAGIFILLSIILSITSSVWLVLGGIAIVGGVAGMIRSFPNGLGLSVLGILIVIQSLGFISMGFWEFVIAIIAAALIEIGVKLIVSSHSKWEKK
ncbi:MAG: hypothetical protein ABFC76_08645 [Fervidobacterium sp.]